MIHGDRLLLASYAPRSEILRFSGWLSKEFEFHSTHAHIYQISPGPANLKHPFVGSKKKMPRAYSIDFRWRIVWLSVVNHWDANDISQLLCVSERTVRRFVTLFQQTGDIKPKSYRHGPPKLMGDYEQLLLLRLILSYPGIYLHEIQTKLTATLGVVISPAIICRTLSAAYCASTRRRAESKIHG